MGRDAADTGAVRTDRRECRNSYVDFKYDDTPFQFQYTYVNNGKKSFLPAGLPRRFDNAELMAKKLDEEFS